jgi:phosphoribosylaminoimidazole-succinocarboxamide synthase
MTSVKEFSVERPATPDELGEGTFRFTDDYSVFDWGTMPDTIPGKGRSLCTMGAYNFELCDTNHVPTHYRGVRPTCGDNGGDVTDLGDLTASPEEMAISLTQVPDLPFADGAYDYDAYHEAAGENYLIPLEIVFRNSVPPGSSLRRRADPGEYGVEFDGDGDGDDGWPDGTVALPQPAIDFSTKFEAQDRYLTEREAKAIAGKADLARLRELALAVNHLLTRQAERAGFTHEDGKIECYYYRGTIAVADVCGTFDENRFSYDGQELSKEVLRQYYKREHPGWVESVEEAKATARERDRADWRSLCERDPPALPDRVIETVADLYTAGANAYLGVDLFDAPGIDAAVTAVRNL